MNSRKRKFISLSFSIEECEYLTFGVEIIPLQILQMRSQNYIKLKITKNRHLTFLHSYSLNFSQSQENKTLKSHLSLSGHEWTLILPTNSRAILLF